MGHANCFLQVRCSGLLGGWQHPLKKIQRCFLTSLLVTNLLGALSWSCERMLCQRLRRIFVRYAQGRKESEEWVNHCITRVVLSTESYRTSSAKVVILLDTTAQGVSPFMDSSSLTKISN